MVRILERRVEGFTVMEIMVTMVISSIVVLTAFEFYNIFNKLLLKKNNTMESGKEILQFYNALENDSRRAISIELSAVGLIMKNYDEDPVNYEFYDEFVIRNRNIVTDTFRVKVMNLNSIKDKVSGFEKILTMELAVSNDTLPLFIEKSYPNDILINSKILRKQ